MKKLALVLLAVAAVACGDDDKKSKGGNNSCDDCQVEAGSREVDIGDPSSDLIEGAPPVTVPVKLKLAPMADVQVNVVSLDQANATVEPAQLVFTAQNWNASQLLTITAVDDTAVTGDRDVTFEFSLVSDDVSFSNKQVNPLILTVQEDDETPSIKVESEDDFRVAEDGEITLEVTLSAQPEGEVLVPIDLDDNDQAEINLDSMTFGTLSWNIPQELVVTGKDDMEADGDTAFNIVFGPTNSTDELFNQLPALEVSVTSVDGICGNGVVDGDEPCEPTGNEQTTCDYGQQSCSYCSNECTSEAGTPSGFCGDGNVQAGNEQCDEPTTRCPYGQMSCQTCSNCQFTAGQLTGYCGDGIVQSGEGEACDPGVSACCNSQCQVDTNDCTPECLVLSEYWDGPMMDKALEVYNCGNTQISLAGIRVCLVRNSDTTCSASYGFSGSLPAGGTYTLCNSSLSHPQAGSRCDAREGQVTTFNGDDRLLLYVDIDGNGILNPTDARVDAFGEQNVVVADRPWLDGHYTRCNLNAYDGLSTFVLSSYWESLDTSFNYNNAMNGFGVAPTTPCP